ncbi:tRNA lysidine(34) synthetase TilS [Gandjariella thermophila]|uniref:tRNA(Ile)-lysidine synthase n=1 Tax=Gandjariella thermophila TaxID=1931992 RepID=A0A4D4JA10_9PSEU|nr:tRNA lysidine(34) synthetase TilS [Gandjariella thermophila]GDY30767.1 tRNA(Ile)-lysidine synthase [Gandjariella thermophila]
MAGPDPALAAVRTAVRRLLDDAEAAGHPVGEAIAVACSGGADSLALAAATEHVAHRRGMAVHGLVVDHRLQPGSAEVVECAAARLRAFNFDAVRVLPVTVDGPGGTEAAARRARYAALRAAQPAPDALILLGHTLDDQAETVLLGLGRGSGPRSIAGMRPLDPPWGRPLLDIPRAVTEAACRALGVEPWSDPHNADPRFVRVRLRAEVLPLLEEVLQGGVAEALARTAAQLREDSDALDALADELFARAGAGADLAVAPLESAPAAVRRRTLRRWLAGRGVRDLTDAQLRAVDALVGRWRGQGGVWLAGGLVAGRAHGRLTVNPMESAPGGNPA